MTLFRFITISWLTILTAFAALGGLTLLIAPASPYEVCWGLGLMHHSHGVGLLH
jgi:hypothetical protein